MAGVVKIKKASPVKMDERKALGLRSGDTVRVHQKIVEKGKTRIQIFEGLVIATKHGAEAGATFTVRATMSGVGVEKTYPLYTPLIERIEIIRRSKVRGAKLYYIRDKATLETRRLLRNMQSMNLSAGGMEEVEAVAEAAQGEASAE
ncbi:MAG: 50S ribosomal protein L19 [Patescibacteria group bacterium]